MKIDQYEHLLVAVMHHIISDGWSMGVMIKELAALYEAYSKGEASSLAPLDIQYADYAAWQRRFMNERFIEEQLDYWRRALEGAPAISGLPTDKPRESATAFRGKTGVFTLPERLSDDLKILSQRESATLFMTLAAAFNVTLGYYSKNDDLVIGTDIANRNQLETEGLLGFFVNQLVLRTSLSGNPSFDELIRRVRAVALGAYAHQDLPFEKLVEALAPERSLTHSPLFQVKLVLQNFSRRDVELPGLSLTPVLFDIGYAQTDLMVSLEESKGGLTGLYSYNTDLFTPATIEGFLSGFEAVLGAVVEDSSVTLDALYHLLARADGERQQAKRKTFAESRLQRFKNIARKPAAEIRTEGEDAL